MFLRCQKQKKTIQITGKDLVDLGIKEEQVGETLNRMYQLVLEKKLKNNRDNLVSHVINNELLSEEEQVLKMVA